MKQLGLYKVLALGLGLWIDCCYTLAQTASADSAISTNLQPEIIPSVDRLAEVLPSAADSVDSTNLQPEIIPSVDRLADVLPSSADSVDSTNLQPEIIPSVDRLAEVLPSAADSVDSTNLQPEIIPSVDRLADVLPSSWAFSAVRSLVEKYGCIAGDSEKRFRGEQALSRQEFAVALNACLERINTIDGLTRDDLMAVERLQQAFTTELTALRDRVEGLETEANRLESQQFSTTTKLSGQAIFAVNAGGFSGDRVISPRGAIVTRDRPNPTALYRFSLDLNTSFKGTDLLKLRLLAGSPGTNDNAAGFLEPNLGSTLDFAIPGTTQISLSRLYYSFAPTKDLSVTVGARMVAGDFVDKNRFANVNFRDFSTQSLINNFVLLPRPGGAGAAIDWKPNQGALRLRAVYIASNSEESLPENQSFFGGGSPGDIRLFPIAGGGARGGLFGDPYMGVVELEYAPTSSFSARLQYSGGEVLGSNFQSVGANFDWAITSRLGIFGRYGYASYPDTTIGDIRPSYWSAGVSLQNLFVTGDLAGLGVVQPFILTEVGNATQTNIEAFYNFPLANNIRITPLIQIITHPANQNSNGTIVTGTLRTVFTF
ncbi:MAG: carbohydrate porin [Microcoleus sp. PH2017_15_JOR_U_A]|uniref:iron uptake porin n=1 Tax=unclassified Microcoleus TaxID=2642155 RepID=UPI001DB3A6ED|nr:MULTISPECIES: iron uptake porin [unclassified Microcoleus]MCC3498524.1 carbohydrate porin [Microcoleus sp. PH2017_15_JOR_U_A]MCC3599015.1 carbohydrate porin [Microcoleus sp. PH2017_26_ELK_O_A]MCC3624064.1 carbohydrate porin [Microcoleus sp. PH2017_36_ELK_O_B]